MLTVFNLIGSFRQIDKHRGIVSPQNIMLENYMEKNTTGYLHILEYSFLCLKNV